MKKIKYLIAAVVVDLAFVFGVVFTQSSYLLMRYGSQLGGLLSLYFLMVLSFFILSAINVFYTLSALSSRRWNTNSKLKVFRYTSLTYMVSLSLIEISHGRSAGLYYIECILSMLILGVIVFSGYDYLYTRVLVFEEQE